VRPSSWGGRCCAWGDATYPDDALWRGHRLPSIGSLVTSPRSPPRERIETAAKIAPPLRDMTHGSSHQQTPLDTQFWPSSQFDLPTQTSVICGPKWCILQCMRIACPPPSESTSLADFLVSPSEGHRILLLSVLTGTPSSLNFSSLWLQASGGKRDCHADSLPDSPPPADPPHFGDILLPHRPSLVVRGVPR